jgi:hypothetical protein
MRDQPFKPRQTSCRPERLHDLRQVGISNSGAVVTDFRKSGYLGAEQTPDAQTSSALQS